MPHYPETLSLRNLPLLWREGLQAKGLCMLRETGQAMNEPWVALQQERWGFTHFIGDDCDPDGHAVELLAFLRGNLTPRTYRTLFNGLTST
jgi:hypothetical protein